ncbi:helix-hairpin-helix domain-containing protein [Streptomyces katsurahamanus]|uniref:helix-hairpin-helix domain-containing protein n=1 Tax=Streptomyces katsurahamanus TaxID=2577098 RepID=UPI00389AF19B
MAAVVFAVQHFWTGRPQAVRAPELVRQGTTAQERAEPASGLSSPSVTQSGERIVVDVSGKVRRPGVLRLPTGSRVADALRAAGGAEPGTDLDGLNRARVLLDGEQVVVGVPPGAAGTGTPGAVSGTAAAGAAAVPGQPTGPLSLTSATAEQLDTLPGVGPVLAQHIIDYRTRHGGFRSVGQLREVNGIGDRRFADLRSLVRP